MKLPKENTYVLALTNRGTWEDKDDPINVYFKVLKFIRRAKGDCGWAKLVQIDGLPDDSLNEIENVWCEFGMDNFRDKDILAWWDLPVVEGELLKKMKF